MSDSDGVTNSLLKSRLGVGLGMVLVGAFAAGILADNRREATATAAEPETDAPTPAPPTAGREPGRARPRGFADYCRRSRRGLGHLRQCYAQRDRKRRPR